jgi:hypothetical protein
VKSGGGKRGRWVKSGVGASLAGSGWTPSMEMKMGGGGPDLMEPWRALPWREVVAQVGEYSGVCARRRPEREGAGEAGCGWGMQRRG